MAEFFDKVKIKANELKDKAMDTVITPKMIFEKGCRKFVCYSLDDLENTTTVCAVVNEEKNEIQFSGSYISETKDIKGRKFFVGEDKRILVVDEKTMQSKVEEIKQKSKTGNYETTILKFHYASLVLADN